MAPDVTQQPLQAPKPRRWYRRRGWQIFFLLLISVATWVAWLMYDAGERFALLQRLEKQDGCTLKFSAPDWAYLARKISWLPKPLTTWLFEHSRQIDLMEIHGSDKQPLDKTSLSSIADRSWPNLIYLGYRNVALSHGNRVLLPAHCPKLETLFLCNTGVNDKAIDQLLRYAVKLKVIHLVNETISGDGFANIDRLADLKDLNLHNCKLTNFDFLNRAVGLQHIDIGETPITDLQLGVVRKFSDLRDLRLNNTSINGSMLQELRSCSKLSGLQLKHTNITDEAMKLLPQMSNLITLDLSNTKITGLHLFTNGSPESLRALAMNGTQVQLKNLSWLKGHQKLEVLELDDTPADDEGSEVLGTLGSLSRLSLRHSNIGDKTIQSLLSATNLSMLKVDGTNITNASGDFIKRMPWLGMLTVENTLIDNDFLKSLRDHPGLVIVSISNTKINEEGVQHLLQLPRLSTVTIKRGQFCKNAIQQLKDRKIDVEYAETPKPVSD